jgi:hypothetical protein
MLLDELARVEERLQALNIERSNISAGINLVCDRLEVS